MHSFPTNLLTCCPLREAMETPRECRGISERTHESGGCILVSMHPCAREVYKMVYFKALEKGDSFVEL